MIENVSMAGAYAVAGVRGAGLYPSIRRVDQAQAVQPVEPANGPDLQGGSEVRRLAPGDGRQIDYIIGGRPEQNQPGQREQQAGLSDRPAVIDSTSVANENLTDEQRAKVAELKRIDQQVRQHEAAHQAVAGQYAQGGASFSFQTGPDGEQYAVGGEVQIDTSPISGDPQATIAKMQQVRRAALAPAEPSSQDRSVAAKASQIEAEARAELNASGVDGSDEAEANAFVMAYGAAGGDDRSEESQSEGLGQSLNIYA